MTDDIDVYRPVCVCVCVSVIDCWKVIIISGGYSGEPQDDLNDQLQAAAAADADAVTQAEADAGDKPGREKDASAKQRGETKAEQDDAKRRKERENDTENTNNNAKSDSEDDQFAKKRSKSSKYFVTPRPPTSQLVLVVYGDLGKTGVLPLTAENPQDVSFEAGQADEFKVGHCLFSETYSFSDMILTTCALRLDYFLSES